ncbi:EcoAI/FtnUII family type I restriction enzme subunit R [Ralstonia nicotianae]
MNKKSLSERDICTKFISPAIVEAGWDLHTQLREEVSLTHGRILVRGKKATRDDETISRADYVLSFKPGIPLAVVEAKDNNHGVRDGMQQALRYAEMLDVPFAFSSNGDGFIWHDRTAADGVIEHELTLSEFPTPAQLWQRYLAWKGITPEAEPVYTQDYYPGKEARYYQLNAVNRAVEAVTKGQSRILLVMATGTGKTFTAFQIIWRLWKARAAKRILFLADRNILVDQTKTNDFKPFAGAMTKIENRTVEKSYEIYLSLYQAVTGTDEAQNIYRQFSPDFFDLIVIDECHRGSAAEDSAWREILDYFSSAIHLGLTATPKETEEVSNITYFGEPVYTYSLRQGIDDGFLAPYKVVRVDLDKDLGWRPPVGTVDKLGQVVEDRIYNQLDMNRTLVLTQRDVAVAARITEFLRATDRMAKTIVFCEDIDHAARMRQALINANPDLASANPKYVMQITGDNAEGKLELDNFINPRKPYPVIATTSRLMTTGVDAKTCKLVVLDRTIKSMTEFKQIIGRGTRIDEEHDKLWFTILDFKQATALFADPAFDGDPVVVYDPAPDEPVLPPDEAPGGPLGGADGTGGSDGTPGGNFDGPGEPTGPGRTRYVLDHVPVRVAHEQVQYLGPDGKLITESLRDFTRIQLNKRYASLDGFLQAWNAAERKEAILVELEKQGVVFEELAEMAGKELDPFDLICHIAFDQPPLTRRERAERVRKRNVFGQYGDTARRVLQALLDKYADAGITNIEHIEVLKLAPLNEFGSPVEIITAFGGKANYQAALQELERALYQ